MSWSVKTWQELEEALDKREKDTVMMWFFPDLIPDWAELQWSIEAMRFKVSSLLWVTWDLSWDAIWKKLDHKKVLRNIENPEYYITPLWKFHHSLVEWIIAVGVSHVDISFDDLGIDVSSDEWLNENIDLLFSSYNTDENIIKISQLLAKIIHVKYWIFPDEWFSWFRNPSLLAEWKDTVIYL